MTTSEPVRPNDATRGLASVELSAFKLELIVIGASTGGPRAITDLFSEITEKLPWPVCIVQHMLKGFSRSFAETLDRLGRHSVRHASKGRRLRGGEIILAESSSHLVIRRHGHALFAYTNTEPPRNGSRPSVDTLFESAATACGAGALGLVLTGMGNDALLGSRSIQERRGTILIQDAGSSAVWGMPGAVAKEGIHSAAATPKELGRYLASLAQKRRGGRTQ